MPSPTDRPGQGPAQRPGKPRSSGTGRYVRTEETAERDAKACQLRNDGLTYAQIAVEMGYADHSSARKAVARALVAIVAEPAGRQKTLMLSRMDAALAEAFRIMRADHIAHSNGRVIMDPADPTKPLLDDGPKLQAIDRIIKVEDRRAKLIGLDAPVKVDLPTAAQVEAEIARRAAELGLNTEETDR